MTDRLNKTSICSIVFLDIIDYSKKSVSEQIDDKTLFNALINEAIENVAQNDRIIIDTGDGAAITLMGAPEEALFVALTIRDGILEHNKTAEIPLLVRIGINLGSVRVVKDINDRPNIIGDGINVAQRIMSFAGENQILVSRSYFEVTSRLTKEITSMFTYSGIKQDKHVREHEVYLIKPKDGQEVNVVDEPVDLDESFSVAGMQSDISDKVAHQPTILMIGAIVLILVFLAWLFLKPEVKPDEVKLIEAEKTLIESPPANTKSTIEEVKKLNADNVVAKPASVKQKSLKNNTEKYTTKTQSTRQSTQAVKKEPSLSFRHECTQAERSLSQCHQ